MKKKTLTQQEKLRAELFKVQLQEITDVQRHRREMERMQEEHLASAKRLHDEHIAHVKKAEAAHAETIAVLKEIRDQITAMRLEAKPPLVWWPISQSDPGPLVPSYPYPYRDPITCGLNTECSTNQQEPTP